MTNSNSDIDASELTGRPLQDLFKVQCFGCGALNEHGLQIKSHRVGDELVCRWQPEPFHIGHPGFVFGGTIASVVDCHSIWTAMEDECRATGHNLAQAPPAFAYVTGNLSVKYIKPVAVDMQIELRAVVKEKAGRKTIVSCRVLQGETLCAVAEVVTVKVTNLVGG